MSAERTNTRHSPAGRRSAASSVPQTPRKGILASRNRFWRPSDFPGSASTVQHLLAELTRAGELRRVRRGLYWRGIPTPLGMSSPPVDALVNELVHGKGVGPSGLSAANLLRLSTQVPRSAEVAVPRRPPSAVGPVRFVSRASRTGRRTSHLEPTEVALLEALERWDYVVELPADTARTRMIDLIRSGNVRTERLVKAAKTEPASVRARLAAVLEDAGLGDLARRVPPVDARTKAHALAPQHEGVV